jgi:hypothetical protein
LFGVGARHLENDGFIGPERAIHRNHALRRDEDPPILKVEEHSKIGVEMNDAFERNEVPGGHPTEFYLLDRL